MPKFVIARNQDKKSQRIAATSIHNLKKRLREHGDGKWDVREFNVKLGLAQALPLIESPFKVKKDGGLVRKSVAVVKGNVVRISQED